jgi:hypothetical protein
VIYSHPVVDFTYLAQVAKRCGLRYRCIGVVFASHQLAFHYTAFYLCEIVLLRARWHCIAHLIYLISSRTTGFQGQSPLFLVISRRTAYWVIEITVFH